MPSLSVVIITYNEERNIGRCLDSVKDIADEIVVLDSFSTDRTEAICKEKGAKFFQHAFDGHIEQKNRAVTYARFPHVLSLDADEALSEELKRSILEVKNTWTRDGYYMNRLTNYCGKWIKHCGWYPDAKLRLWDSRKGKWTGVNPHDRYEMLEGDRNTGFLRGDLLHYSYYTLDDHYRQIDYFTDISARELFRKDARAGWLRTYSSPVIKFVRDYFIKLGFLDGKAGFTISRISAYGAFLKYKKLRTLRANAKSS
ncbi:MAG: glycosyltransferase family 2 protein [Bacteroidota bacterium]